MVRKLQSNNMNNKNITALILIVLAGGIYFTMTKNVWNEALQIKNINDQYASAIVNAEQLISVRDKVLRDYNSISQEDRARLDKMVPNTVDNIRLIIDLNNVAARHGFSLKNIQAIVNVEDTRLPPPIMNQERNQESLMIANQVLDTVKVSFSVTAPYQQVVSFLQDLEADLRISDLTKLSVKVNENGTYDFSVEITTYWLRQ